MPSTPRSFYYLIVRAASEAEGSKAVWEWVKPETCHPHSLPFVKSAGLYIFEVSITEGRGAIREWANCYKENNRPQLYAFLEAPDPALRVAR